MQDRIKEIMDRLEKATPAPWTSGYDNGKLKNYVVGKFKEYRGNENGRPIVGQVLICDRLTNVYNADFIANSPADIKFLLDALQQSQDRERVLETSLDEAKQLIATIKRIREMKDERIAHQGRLIDQHRDRERVLREALKNITTCYAFEHGEEHIYVKQSMEALKQEVKS